MWCFIDNDFAVPASVFAGCATAPALTGPWTWQHFYAPGGQSPIGDENLFVDQDGSLWFVYRYATNNNINAIKIDPTTDYTSFTGSVVTLATPSVLREGVVLFVYQGSYYLVASETVILGTVGAVMNYKAASGSSLTNVASALVAVAWNSLWNFTPATAAVANSAQSGAILQIPGMNGFLFYFDLDDAGESINAGSRYHMRTVLWPLPWSALTTGGSPAIAMPAPASWNFLGSVPLTYPVGLSQSHVSNQTTLRM